MLSAMGSYYYEEQPQGPALSQLLAQGAKAGVDWSGKVEWYQQLEVAVQAAGPQATSDMAGNAGVSERCMRLWLPCCTVPLTHQAAWLPCPSAARLTRRAAGGGAAGRRGRRAL